MNGRAYVGISGWRYKPWRGTYYPADLPQRRELEYAISCVREARRAGSGVAASDAAWRQAKFRVIELETGAPPEWAHRDASDVREVNGDGNGNEGDSS